MFILSGLFNKLTETPAWISWLQYASPFRYGFHLIMLNEFQDETFGTYDYRADLGYTLSYGENFAFLGGLTLFFYVGSLVLLKFNTDKVVA